MELAHRQASERSRTKQWGTKGQVAERRRVKQLVISLVLFFLVFFGRGAFPELAENLSELMSSSTDFGAIVSNVAAKRDAGEYAIGELIAFIVGEEPSETGPAESTNPEKVTVIEPVLLSQTEGCGLWYLREVGIKPYTKPSEVSNEIEKQDVKVVTAVAQTYDAAGEALPANVSYEYYELGLDHTVDPVNGGTTSGFGYRISPITGEREFHLAIDIAAETGTEILAFADGVVRYIGESDDFGLYFMIDHDNGVATFYAHCSKLMVRKGDVVSCGQVVALVGETGKTTGPHLHFTIEKDKIRLDPAQYVAM